MTPENTEIPDMWRKCIEVRNPDMIVLYNSSVGALLRQDGAMYLQKMTDIFNELARQNIFIIWRPHPLMESTLRSMRTDYYELYLKIKTAFTENNMGLIDESADMHPAMLISDMYCGDWSSLVWLYQITGKPIIISEENTQRMQHYNGGNDASANRDYIKVKNVINREFVEFDAYSPKPPEKAGRHIYETIMDKIVKDIK
jgi:CDP-glycerol glycerophosphotransferase (TagB/SpsB family)